MPVPRMGMCVSVLNQGVQHGCSRRLLAALALQVVHRIDRDEVVVVHFASPPNPRRAGAAAGAVPASAAAGVLTFSARSSDLLTLTVDCSAVWRGFMCR